MTSTRLDTKVLALALVDVLQLLNQAEQAAGPISTWSSRTSQARATAAPRPCRARRRASPSATSLRTRSHASELEVHVSFRGSGWCAPGASERGGARVSALRDG